jgi:hypothetical protein
MVRAVSICGFIAIMAGAALSAAGAQAPTPIAVGVTSTASDAPPDIADKKDRFRQEELGPYRT